MKAYKSIIALIAFMIFNLVFIGRIHSQLTPNIIYILSDDLGYGDLGILFQNQKNQNLPVLFTPNLDAMAKSGAVLTQHYSNAPVCAPSRASLLTGVNQGNAEVRDNQFDKALENNHTIATVLKNAGYLTIAIGKWGLQGLDENQKPNWPAHPLNRGFDEYFGYMRHTDGHEHYPVEGLYRGKKEIWANFKEVSKGFEKCYTTDLWTARAKNYIIAHEKNKLKKPFFMYLAYDAPHAALELPTQKYPQGGGLYGGLKWLGQNGHMINTASGEVDSYVHPDYQKATFDNDNNTLSPEIQWPETYKRYATAVRRLDEAVGDIRKLLFDLKIDNNTLIVFSSDNGPSIESYLPEPFPANSPAFFESYGPFDGIKRDCLEGGIRMPALASWPKHIASGTIINTPSMLSDWLPTFAAAANVPPPARTTGISLIPVLTNCGKQENSLVYAEYFEPGKTPDFKEFENIHANRRRNQMQMIRIGDFVGLRYDIKSTEDKFEIYDIVKDPKQKHNLAHKDDFLQLQNEMKAKVLQLRTVNLSAPRPYDKIPIPPVNLHGSAKKGIKWSFFQGEFNYTPLFPPGKADADGVVKVLSEIKKNNPGAFVYTTLIKIPETGIYSFKLVTHGKAFVKLHEANLLDADFNYKPGETVYSSATLESGFHPLTIYYLNSQVNHQGIKLQVKSPEGYWRNLNEFNCYY